MDEHRRRRLLAAKAKELAKELAQWAKRKKDLLRPREVLSALLEIRRKRAEAFFEYVITDADWDTVLGIGYSRPTYIDFLILLRENGNQPTICSTARAGINWDLRDAGQPFQLRFADGRSHGLRRPVRLFKMAQPK